MTVVRSEHGVLTTNATTYQYYDYTLQNYITSTGQWTQEDNYSISRRFNPPVPAVQGQTYQIDKVVFNGYSGLGYDLLFNVSVFQGSTKLFESGFAPNNTEISIYTPTLSYGDSPTKYAIVIWVMRADGNQLSRQDMRPSTVNCNARFYQPVEVTTEIPPSWYETTTATFQNPMDTYTTIIPTDYDISSSQYDPLLEIPQKIDTAINFAILGFGRIMNFKYITFVVCFVLIVGLVAWLIH